jgi:hypothetical protein
METNGGCGLNELRPVFPELEFRHFANCRVPRMTWQAGRNVCVVIRRSPRCPTVAVSSPASPTAGRVHCALAHSCRYK